MKELKFSLEGQSTIARLGSKISPEDLYGEVKTVVESRGRQLEAGYLSPEGRLLRRQQISTVSVDPGGTITETPVMLFDGEVVEPVTSSFEQESVLREVPLVRLVGFNVNDVYWLDVANLKPGLYETTFNYRASVQPRLAYLLIKPNEAFLLVGQAKRTAFIGKTHTYEFFDAPEGDGAEADPLDFSMM